MTSRAKKSKPIRRQTRDDSIQKKANISLITSIVAIFISGLQGCNGYQQLQDSRAAAIKITSDSLTGTRGYPDVWMHVQNLSNHKISAARVSGRLALLPPERAVEIFDNMKVRTQQIQPQDKENQHLFVDTPLTQRERDAWRDGDLVLIGAISATWRDRGAWARSTSRRCFAWTFGGELACEDLIEDPKNAREEIQNFIKVNPNGGPGTG